MKRFFIKSPVFPFAKFPGVDPDTESRDDSNGEVMELANTFGEGMRKR